MPPVMLPLSDFVRLVYIEQEILGCDLTSIVEYQRTGVLPQWAIDKMKVKENK